MSLFIIRNSEKVKIVCSDWVMLYNTKHLGRIIRLRRVDKGLTLEIVAESCDLSVRGLEKIELGDSDPKWSNVVKIAGVLELDLGDLSVCVTGVERCITAAYR